MERFHSMGHEVYIGFWSKNSLNIFRKCQTDKNKFQIHEFCDNCYERTRLNDFDYLMTIIYYVRDLFSVN